MAETFLFDIMNAIYLQTAARLAGFASAARLSGGSQNGGMKQTALRLVLADADKKGGLSDDIAEAICKQSLFWGMAPRGRLKP
ncbi:hypothetical protein [Kingella potus]|uniref:hypothetical protein n=1 Tax=Kingella potus TaxID=265175 RepID=UPI0011C031A7|nr:hypothetical protein [Kingella potus]UOP00760.1 hypothetical protein LVJ84_13480 [Kingella potus]